jgi:hypothetical protein
MRRIAITAALAASAILGIAQPASASWLQQTTPTAGTNWTLSAVSCTATTSCVTVGNVDGSLLSETRSGNAWTIVSIPDPGSGQLPGISCTTASACEAVGQFTSGGTVQALAEVWNGSNWAIQATPNPSGATSSQLNDVSCTSAARCEAVGQFTSSGGTVQALAEVWNGSNWAIQATPNASGPANSQLDGVSCPAASACEAVGSANTGSTFTTLAEMWNGTKWAIQATPNPGGSTFSRLDGVSCTAASACTATGTNLAERWNGTSWTLQAIAKPKGSTGTPDLSRVSCTDKTRCMAVGSFPLDAVQTALSEQWNGTKWTIQATPITTANDSSGLSGVSCTFATACTGVGFYHDPNGPNHALAEDWSLRWQLQPPLIPFDNPLASSLAAVSCPTTAFCAAVGGEEPTGGVFDALAEIFKGSSWFITSTPNASNSNLDAVSCTGAKACTAVGDVDAGGGTLSTLAERWDGTNWTVQATPDPAGAVHSFLTSVSCSSATSCVAVGFFTNGSGNQTPFAEHWNGTNWTVKSTPSPPVDPATQLNSVSCTSATSCEAVGTSTTKTWAERWNGSAWAMQGIPSPTGGSDVRLRGVSCTAPNACTGVGAYFNGTKLVPLAERWNGSAWAVQAAAVPSGSSSQFSSVSCSTTQFSVGCNAVGSVTKNGIILPMAENWNGSVWATKPVPSPDPMSGVSCSTLVTCMGIGFYDTSAGVEAPLGEQYS